MRTRKESWITASRFSTNNGAAPVPGAQVHIEYAGKTYPQHADALGQLPPIVHPPQGASPTKIKVIKPDGSWQTLVELAHNSKARTGVLVLDMLIMSAYAFSQRAPANDKQNKIPIKYRLQPGDLL